MLTKKIIHLFDSQYIDHQFKMIQQELDGLSGAGTAQLIGRCVSLMKKDDVYLEVGIYQAANLVMVACQNKNKRCYGVDNFSQTFKEDKNFEDMTTEEVVQSRIEQFDVEKNCVYFKDDFREFLKNRLDIEGRKVGVYFFDGPHELQDQIDGVEMALPLLADHAIIFIDDWSSPNVQEAARILLEKHKELKLLKVLKSSGLKWDFNQGQCVLEYIRERR